MVPRCGEAGVWRKGPQGRLGGPQLWSRFFPQANLLRGMLTG